MSADVGAAVAAVSAIPDAQQATAPVSAGAVLVHKATIHLKPLLSFPWASRFVARMRQIDEMITEDAERQAAAYAAAYASVDSSAGGQVRSTNPATSYAPMPGPWGFFTSGYAIGLFVMTFLLNRIQNVVVPPRHPLATHLSRAHRDRRSLPRSVWRKIFPLDLSSTLARTVLRLPTLYFMLRSMLLWTIILLQASALFPAWSALQPLAAWADAKEMDQICWSTFLSICGALCVGTLTRGLEGAAATNPAPFNLFGYTFMLHVYASPVTHVNRIPGQASRPELNILITVMIPLFQLTIMHLLGVRQRWSRMRLLPTGLCTLLSLLHFHYVVWFTDTHYPLLNYVPCVLESLLAGVTLLTAGLSALTQLLMDGSVRRPLFLFGHEATLRPRWDEDFSVVLLRLGTASLDATSVAGLGNEVGGVLAPEMAGLARGTVELNRLGVSALVSDAVPRGPRKSGFANEIKRVTAKSNEADLLIDGAWYRELVRFVFGLWRLVRGLGRWVWARLRGKPVHWRGADANGEESRELARTAEDRRVGAHKDEDDVYARFLRGEPVSDDEDDFNPRDARLHSRSLAISRTSSYTGSISALSDADDDTDVPEDAMESDDDDDVDETGRLYADHLASAGTSSATAPLLLAHMTSVSSSPLTRRGYGKLVARRHGTGDSGADTDGNGSEWERFVDERRVGARERREAQEAASPNRLSCVICTVEPRQIISWPCRCLALCEDCRFNLATRSSASKHICPCCRQSVEGYSRIYIP